MNKNITLDIDEKVAIKALDYAAANDISLSKIFEAYLVELVKPQKKF
ncbi:hypothetical protein SAMN05192588_0915 [Nonlabens sp. Hel1_33_55]|nr:DUF6364 family protein [Nonlabens sp. Hel1_33_55]SCY05477.1 hypothetical protein SAMN05192588_0915 [Nonlabens sp. Hel1_33_55]